VAIVDRGRIVVSGTPEELKSGLQGDTIHVALPQGQGGAARRALGRLSDVGSAEVDGDELRVRARDGAVAVPAVLAALDAHGASAASLTLARPSLDEVYLRHTGRRLQETERLENHNQTQEVAA
jgi:ABC-2 type transport system ATP-binding protein